MKDLFLTNIIDYLISNDIKFDNVYDEKNDINRKQFNSEIYYSLKDDLWTNMSSKLKFDDITLHLLNRFAHAVNAENYEFANTMKKEIHERWDITDEEIAEVATSYLQNLQAGIDKSELLSHFSKDIQKIREMWSNGKTEHIDTIVSELDDIYNIMRYTPCDSLVYEIHESIFKWGGSIRHPSVEIEVAIEFLKFFK